jgi:uncharacterized protein with HEPN domain
MPPEERDPASLWDMRQALARILRYTGGKTLAELSGDELLTDGVIRQFTILGEAASRISAALRSRTPEIPWQQIVGLRNVVVHQYDRVILEELWGIVTDQVPSLLQRIDALLPPPPNV